MAQKPVTRDLIADILDGLAMAQFKKAHELLANSHEHDPILYADLKKMEILRQSDVRWRGAHTLLWIDKFEKDRGTWRHGCFDPHHMNESYWPYRELLD